ncbi:MAG: flagellar motor switch phosphatase FliY [Porcipelethomonas sp.]
MGEPVLDELKTDAIGEIHNITMGSAAIAVSGMIDAAVSITTPQVSVCKASEIVRSKLKQSVKGILFNKDEDAVYVKINYIKGIKGTSVLVLNANDVQMIVNKLMGMPMELRDDFEFDEMSISAISEVMNQMMGASATSLSQLLNIPVDISPPETKVSSDTKTLYRMQEIAASDIVCAVSFDLTIDDKINSKFITLLSPELAEEMAKRLYDVNMDGMPDSDDDAAIQVLSTEKIDAIGEIQNIMMGSAATALSKFMDAKVLITTPKVSVNKAGKYDFGDLDPSICIRIKYIKGVKGASVMVLRQNDVQMMVNHLMGMPPEVSDDFEFNEMSISAVCEIMNQMMGASATTLSEIINMPTDISTPEPIIIDSINDILKVNNVNESDDVCTISFNLSIDGMMNSHFVTMLSIDLANEMADKMIQSYSSDLDEYSSENAPSEPASSPAHEPVSMPEPPKPAETKPSPQPKAVPKPDTPAAPAPKVEAYRGSSFDDDDDDAVDGRSFLTEKQYKNLKSLLDVPMTVSVVIGSTQKSIDEVGNFTKGTVIELDTLADEPVDVLVNGNLIAKGDVVVVDDNFAIRITEIVK